MAMFVSRLPVGVTGPELEEIPVSQAAVRSARAKRILRRSLWTEYKY